MVDLQTIKLIIWDLDDTFWEGIISEGPISIIPENVQFIKSLTDCGIINSICSKNDYSTVEKELIDLNINDLFVFPSINWENKSPRIQQIIEQMSLRPANVLFIDDNTSNLGEASYLIPGLQICGPDSINGMIHQIETLPKSDISHERLNHYKVLEKKRAEEKTFKSNEEFLFASDIRVDICHDCNKELHRIHELVLRSNQLNFTKKRDSQEELTSLFQNKEFECGYVKVRDKFGDYGIVGFYALRDNRLYHFVFSCRTLGQGIEQYVYGVLGSPDIQIIGDVRCDLKKNYIPRYINQTEPSRLQIEEKSVVNCSVLMKGPCDLSHAIMYIKNNKEIDTEFTYIKEGTNKTIDAYNHSVHIEQLKSLTKDQMTELSDDCPFIDRSMFESNFFEKNYDVIFLSSLIESVRGIYKKKGSGIQVVFGQRNYPLNDEKYWQYYLDNAAYPEFNLEFLKKFSQNYEFIGATTPENYTAFLKKCISWLSPQTTLCIILGSTYPFPGEEAHCKYHQEINDAVKSLAKTEGRLRYIEIDRLADKSTDYEGSIDHFTTEVYYKLANSMVRIIEDVTGVKYKQPDKLKTYFVRLLNHIRKYLKRHFNPRGRAYGLAKKVYLLLSGKKDIVK